MNISADTGLVVTVCCGQCASTGSLSIDVQLISQIQICAILCCQRMSVSQDEVNCAGNCDTLFNGLFTD